MLRFAANISTLYRDKPFLERFELAREDGFSGVEMLFPYAIDVDEIEYSRRDARQKGILLNAYPGNWDTGDRGLAALPGREVEFLESIELAIHYAVRLGIDQIHVLAGSATDGGANEQMHNTYIENLKRAAAKFRKVGLTLLIEPINPVDIPCYFLNKLDQARSVLAQVKADNVKIQMDFYHTQLVEGNLLGNFQKHFAQIRHLQIAGAPGRHEPDIGEINYQFVLDAIDASNYKGWVGCEYSPSCLSSGGTSSGLGWLKQLRVSS